MLRTREELETLGKSVVLKAYVIRFQVIDEIRERGLYAPEYMGFYDYLYGYWGFSEFWWDQTKRSVAKSLETLERFGVTLGNENAARKMRAVSPDLEEKIIIAAQRLAGQGNPVMGKHLSAVQRQLTTVCLTDHVDLGDGEMTAFDAACHIDLAETAMRQHQHRVDGAKKNGWCKPIRFRQTDNYSVYLPAEWLIPEDKEIEIKWRAVEGTTE